MIDFNDPAQITNAGGLIPIRDQGTYDSLWASVSQIYTDAGHSPDGGDRSQFDSRVRGGQTIDQIITNTYDEVQRRFKVPDTPQTRAEELTGARPSYDSQSNSGVAFDPPDVMLEELAAPARQQAAMWSQQQLAAPQVASTYTARNSGPGAPVYGASGGGGLGLPSMGTILMLGAGAVAVVLLWRAFGKKG